MTDFEVVEVQPNSPERHAFGGPKEDVSGERDSDSMESLNTGQGETEESLSLAVVTLAPPCGDHTGCSCDCEACNCQETRWMERNLQSTELQLQFLMSKADYLHDCLVDGQGHLEREALAAAVPSFLYTCQPFFNHLESTSTVSQHTPLPFDIYARRVQLLDFSQQLCDRLEQLVLTYASYNALCLDETKPNSVSHFCIGQSQLGPLRVTTFRYCTPTPYLARVDTGLYKRMRWNVERLRDEQQTEEESEAEIVGDTVYYFLCYEDIPNAHAEVSGDNQDASNVVRMWSIGQWVQVTPLTEDIYGWITCEVPQADYHRLLFLGSEEPSSCSATDYLQQLLLPHKTTE
ncbi:UPF0575 protein C19orf67 homolog isoform X1 [Etheostoma spectabile]|uniref:UPF0575 protein C19orf67 homolog isoform X1 n=1 Tax=Etheostoma spectabile TaxID=54343 RepID=UPI0013AF5B52|nr:UPF0575 protein C19orf67 homolog isoform X1 [Etheostoma spectabile]XP_032399743.1 UPF0575 protein C19orf67 homolog isoform X1 [Etheostoma spectabile]